MITKKRFLPVLLCITAVGAVASLAATTKPISNTSLDGKFVLIEQVGVINSVHGNSRFESVGQTDFVVFPMQHAGSTVTYDYWIPLRDVSLLRVFHSKEDADEYMKNREKQRQ